MRTIPDRQDGASLESALDLRDYLTALTTLVASSSEDMSAEDLYALLKPAQTLANKLAEAKIR